MKTLPLCFKRPSYNKDNSTNNLKFKYCIFEKIRIGRIKIILVLVVLFLAARVSAFGSDDEEFESVSQVTGPVSNCN